MKTIKTYSFGVYPISSATRHHLHHAIPHQPQPKAITLHSNPQATARVPSNIACCVEAITPQSILLCTLQ